MGINYTYEFKYEMSCNTLYPLGKKDKKGGQDF